MNDYESAVERFWRKVQILDTGCWVWSGALNSSGYGEFRWNGRSGRAHRFAYQSMVGPIPEGLQLDHLCRVRACVNPAHLEPVTPAENNRRGDSPRLSAERKLAKTHCPQGHAYEGENLFIDGRGRRNCRTCRRQQIRESQRRLIRRRREGGPRYARDAS